jgi:SAM-dependent methyltransferase
MRADPGTQQYFDEHCPEYSPKRLAAACSWIVANVDVTTASLLDIGCGTGNVLAFVAERTGLRDIVGMDASREPLARARERLGCPTVHASILDPEVVAKAPRRFDLVLLAAVLHHLVGPTRTASQRLARAALGHAFALTAPGGHTIVVEPVFSPRAPLTAVFYAKRATSRFTGRRIELFNTWNNLGPPVVSYFTSKELGTLARGAGAVIASRHAEHRRLHPLMRAAGLRQRLDETLILAPPPR